MVFFGVNKQGIIVTKSYPYDVALPVGSDVVTQEYNLYENTTPDPWSRNDTVWLLGSLFLTEHSTSPGWNLIPSLIPIQQNDCKDPTAYNQQEALKFSDEFCSIYFNYQQDANSFGRGFLAEAFASLGKDAISLASRKVGTSDPYSKLTTLTSYLLNSDDLGIYSIDLPNLESTVEKFVLSNKHVAKALHTFQQVMTTLQTWEVAFWDYYGKALNLYQGVQGTGLLIKSAAKILI
jgi:hypothetical protein